MISTREYIRKLQNDIGKLETSEKLETDNARRHVIRKKKELLSKRLDFLRSLSSRREHTETADKKYNK